MNFGSIFRKVDKKMYAIVIGASDETTYAISQAKTIGMTVIAFDGNKDAEGLKYADEAYVVDIRNPNNIYGILDKKDISKKNAVVIPVPIGRYLISSGAVNDHYGLVGTTEKTADICTDKWLFHQKLCAIGLRNIRCTLLEKGQILAAPQNYPVIVKPRYGAGSRAVLRVDSSYEWDKLRLKMPYDEDFIVEDAVNGQEFGIDGMVINGVFHLILARKKLITPPPYRQCVGYISTNNDRCRVLTQKLGRFMERLVHAIELENGIVHADLILNGENPFVIEMSARPSGHRLHDLFTPLVTGVDMVSEFLTYAVSGRTTIAPVITDKVYIIRYFDMESEIKTILNKEDVLKKYPILRYKCNLQLGEKKQITDGHSLMGRGYFILEAESEESACEIANNILEEYV